MLRGFVYGILIQSVVIAAIVAFGAVMMAVAEDHKQFGQSHPEQFTKGYDWRQPIEQR